LVRFYCEFKMENKLNIKFAGQIRTERPDSGRPEYNVASTYYIDHRG